MIKTEADGLIDSVREFNRFYTKQIGVLRESWYKTDLGLTDLRVLYEISHRDRPTATEVREALDLDAGYVSRILRKFESAGIVRKIQSESDRRSFHIALTKKGGGTFAKLNQSSHDEIGALLSRLPASQQKRLVSQMRGIQQLLGADNGEGSRAAYLIRAHQPGDIGWITYRHGVLYAQEYGWDERFEALVGEIAAKFILNLDPKRERCWIAEKDGDIAGCVFLVKKSKTVAKLRLLLVEPTARGLGIGSRLVDECIRFARQSGYRKITLWTQSVLIAARHIYKQKGFALVHKEPYHNFGQDLVTEIWELNL
jgi:DNA-binding MarR family transcriptional regulator/N-acetylglutamate synthase-like GNAT family acetyltransferase